MKHIILSLSTICLFSSITLANKVMVLEGHYQGKNLYIQNPFAGSGVGFCVYEVKVNGQVTTDETNSSAFEVDFKVLDIKFGEAVTVSLSHKDDCLPKILNPEVLKPRSTFETTSISMKEDETLNWSTRGEMGKLPFTVEQFRWNKWVTVGEVEGKGIPGVNDYLFQVKCHSGENQFRVKQVDATGKPRYSATVKYNSPLPQVQFEPVKPSTIITFSGETLYEIYDSFGNAVKKGYGSSVDISNLTKGLYYINFDNTTGEFTKK